MAAAASSDFVAAYIIGMEPVFGFRIEYRLPLKYYWFAMILGVVLALIQRLQEIEKGEIDDARKY